MTAIPGVNSHGRVVRVTLAQIDSALGDVEGNFRRAMEVLDQARDERADMVVFPELSLTGYPVGQVSDDVSLEAADETFEAMLGAHESLAVVVGFAEAGRLHTYNSAAYLEDRRLVHLHRKLYLPTYGGYEERKH